MRILITGSNGFVGEHLTALLEKEGHAVSDYNLSHGEDLRDYETLRNELDLWRPERIYHLAAQAYVPESFANPKRTFEVNTLGSLNLLEAVRQLGIKPKILLAGTSEEYGTGDVSEESKPEPKSPYAISKLAMDHLGQLYAQAYGMHVVVTRAFNHCGPDRGEMYAESSFAKQIVEVELGRKKVVQHGNLESVRNYTDVRDIVRAYEKAIELPPDVYNICSDQNITMQTVMDELVKLARCDIKLKTNRALYRPADFSFMKPSCRKFKDLTGWEPEYTIGETLNDVLESWRDALSFNR